MEEENVNRSPLRKREELNPDVLAIIFSRLDLTDLLLSIPFVCKPWKSASLAPSCWRNLDFERSYRQLWSGLVETYRLENFSFSGLLRLLLPRSQGSATHLFLPTQLLRSRDNYVSTGDLQFLSTHCPKLKFLAFSTLYSEQKGRMLELIGKWKNLEGLSIVNCPADFVTGILAEISSSCKSFGYLLLGSILMSEELACVLVDLFPEIKQLEFLDSVIEKEYLMQILKGCKHLVSFSVKDCIGIEDNDEEILKYAGSIKRFPYHGCQLSWLI